MHYLHFRGEVTLFKMQVTHFEMQVVHFPLPLPAFSPEIRPRTPTNRGRPRRPAPLLRQRYEILRPKTNNVKKAGAAAGAAIMAAAAIITFMTTTAGTPTAESAGPPALNRKKVRSFEKKYLPLAHLYMPPPPTARATRRGGRQRPA